VKVAILGLGRFGTQLVQELVGMGVEVLAVDRDDARVNAVAETATLAAAGNLTDFDFVSSLELTAYDSVTIAMGDTATSVLLALTLKKRMAMAHLVAKASTSDHAEALRLAGADVVVSPEQEAAVRLAHTLGPASYLGEYLSLGPTFGCAKLDAPPLAFGLPVGSADAFRTHNVLLLALIRQNKVTFRPDQETVVEPGDQWLIAGDDEQLRRASSAGQIVSHER
jgi:trk system potassium uptake protein TrkA